MRCPVCGREVESRFCPDCGTEVNPAAGTEKTRARDAGADAKIGTGPSDAKSAKKQGKQRGAGSRLRFDRTTLLLILIIAAGLLLTVAGIYGARALFWWFREGLTDLYLN